MNSRKRPEDALINRYKANLEGRVENGDRSLVCRDGELCKEVEVLLRKGNCRNMHNLRGLNSLTVMEKSLHALPSKTGRMGLEKLSKAFEVLELAALNLYLYPWRREYRLVKMFSGMFTHLIKPALTLQQTKELFGLLGYQASGLNEEEELILNSEGVPAETSLSLACGFFTSRIECQLLLSALGSSNRDVEWVLRLVKERQAGHSLQEALENMDNCMDSEPDLYSAPAGATSQVASSPSSSSSSSSPPRSPYPHSKDAAPSKYLQKEPSLSDMTNNEDPRQGRSLNNNQGANAQDQSGGESKRRAATKRMCSCIKITSLYIYMCEQCDEIHSSQCSHYTECKRKKHTLALCSDGAKELHSTQEQLRSARDKPKNLMKTHSCMANSTSDLFSVCYDCQAIHEHNCQIIKVCKLEHNVQLTGKLQPAQDESANVPKRHKCLSAGAPVFLTCHTCNKSHGFHCAQEQTCAVSRHDLQYSELTGDFESEYHSTCLKKKAVPEVLCLTCAVFHSSRCPDGRDCSQKHKTKAVGTNCIECASSNLETLCRYCGFLYCNLCLYKNTMLCKCGKPLARSSPV